MRVDYHTNGHAYKTGRCIYMFSFTRGKISQADSVLVVVRSPNRAGACRRLLPPVAMSKWGENKRRADRKRTVAYCKEALCMDGGRKAITTTGHSRRKVTTDVRLGNAEEEEKKRKKKREYS